ncbi:uncharacterized protein [Medicago truncatula]|uniref:Ubiquitin carboxyl-terminal hydrolase 7 ICP0-binding domain-containing protein n=1 Tax=Medicago truncatula TaxID=3880 RepID=G7KD57_MEDTR|nr:uncharacterized protein LOC11423348 [Medicago truncatula]AET00385.1 hypothetical protein MTR_5g091430 [Medicago truncatula]
MAETHLYTMIKVVRDEDLAEQIGNDIYFDLVDLDKVRSFRVKKQTSFNVFKNMVAREFGILAQFQRFWIWKKRVNGTYRPYRPLTYIEEAKSVGQLKELYEDDKLKLFLEVEHELDLCPIAPLYNGEDDILLFFKLHNPERKKLSYVGRLIVNCKDKPSDILARLNKLAGYDPNEEIELYEEIKFKPNVMCLPIKKESTFQESELENGDIICFQKAYAIDTRKYFHLSDVPSFLKMKAIDCQVSPFRSSDIESKDEESLEEKNKIIIAEERNVVKNTEAQQSKVDIETTYDEGTNKANTLKFVSKDLKEIDAMIDEDVIGAIDRVLSEGITLSLKSHHSVQKQEVSKLDPNFQEQLLMELRDIAFKEDLVEKFKQGLTPKVSFNTVMEKIEANVDMFSSHQLEQVGVVVNLVKNIARMFEQLKNLKKLQDLTKNSTDQNNEALKEARQNFLISKACLTDHQTQLKSLDIRIADIKAKLEKLQGDRAKMAEIQDQEKDKITSFNNEVKSIFHRLADDQIKLKSVEDKILEAQTELERHEKVYQIMRVMPPF